nr:hypothetical protein CFP56_00313 [Quercus suber]
MNQFPGVLSSSVQGVRWWWWLGISPPLQSLRHPPGKPTVHVYHRPHAAIRRARCAKAILPDEGNRPYLTVDSLHPGDWMGKWRVALSFGGCMYGGLLSAVALLACEHSFLCFRASLSIHHASELGSRHWSMFSDQTSRWSTFSTLLFETTGCMRYANPTSSSLDTYVYQGDGEARGHRQRIRMS